jgi:hypothetical protein
MLLFLLPFFSLVLASPTSFIPDMNYSNYFPNPERGFYSHQETHLSKYESLTLTSMRRLYSSSTSLVLRLVYFDGYNQQPNLPSSFLKTLLPNDLATIRTAGLKAILRFAYTEKSTSPYNDAPVQIVLEHLDQLSPIIKENIDVIAVIQIGFVGSWGEWYEFYFYVYFHLFLKFFLIHS